MIGWFKNLPASDESCSHSLKVCIHYPGKYRHVLNQKKTKAHCIPIIFIGCFLHAATVGILLFANKVRLPRREMHAPFLLKIGSPVSVKLIFSG
jgi:hypothetical protein